MKEEYVLSVVMTITGSIGLFMINELVKTLRKMAASIDDLNVKIAVVCDRVDNHDRRIERLENL